MKKIIYALCLFAFHFLICNLQPAIYNLYAQPVTQEWVRRYNEPGNMNDHATSLALDKFGNAVVTGYCQTQTQSTNIVTIKYSPGGVQQWAVPFNYQSNVADEAHAMVIDTASNIYVAGSSGSFFTEIYDCVLLKYKPSGTLEWSRGYGNLTGAFYTNDLILDRQGNIYVVGTTNVPSGNSVFLLKYTPDGDTIWTRKYKEPGYDRNFGLTIAIDSLNNIIISGSCAVNSNFSDDCLTIKYSSTGSYLWSATYNSGGVNTTDNILKNGIDNNGNVYGTGFGNYSPDVITIKYNSVGSMQWLRTYNGYDNGSDYAVSLVMDLIGNIYITGASVGGPSFTSDFVTIKYNSNGDSLWVRRYNGTGNGSDHSRDITSDDSGNVYIVGVSMGTSANDIATIKYTSSGNQQWVERYPGQPSQFYTGRKIAVDGQRNIFIIGDNSDSGTGSDYVTIKYSQLVGIKPIANNIPKEFALFQNYPNPFNPVTKINYELPSAIGKSNYVKLAAYDILGREIAILVNEKQKVGKYEIEWNGSNYPSGVYFYKIEARQVGSSTVNFVDTKKMVLVK